jgi:hypothetical protein
MKHTFIIDENIIYCGIRGVDIHNNQDFSSTMFLLYVAHNCHKIVADDKLSKRISKHLKVLEEQRSFKPIPHYDLFVNSFVRNPNKFVREFGVEPSELSNEDELPPKDVFIVRAAKYFNATIVTLDGKLKMAIDRSKLLKELGIIALEPKAAIVMAKET